ncbi:MAG: hypothetical protein A2498_05105 [Lentisphaerae bacterium RIFOXYC12_FULL_60_16]|nr:MAG: hypothetical protein A2498_05105 [Lentisphaerae bacterium RIFOXYC12_FULL_60_16]OGV68694.1 MAG: hypothetical protein A2269_04945 [Lentisphaerae bacterium RIFOXYA12_FULL_60_10]OGV86153.1 MAG: hypothetical protein A2340_02545 [Lentisphaerae bacterium RIFOXYB12_FULL_60_10]
MTADSFAFSPSIYHRRRMQEIHPALTFDPADPTGWQRRLRARFKILLGYDPPVQRIPLSPKTRWKQSFQTGTVEKIVFHSEPGVDVPAYVCLPARAKPPYRFFICLQGHSTGMHNSIGVAIDDETRPIKVAGDRNFAIGCMRRGIAALCIEQRSFGERREKIQQQASSHPCHDAVMQAIQLGTTLGAERVFDVDRGIDYLAARGDCDMKRIGIMGNSGGGTVTIFAAALLPRIAVAMPSCSFCTYRDSIMQIYHCGDNYVPGIARWAESADVLGLFAPRPVVIVAGKSDPIFPLCGVRKAYADLRRIYRAFGAEDQCKLVVGRGGHRFYAAAAWRTMNPPH